MNVIDLSRDELLAIDNHYPEYCFNSVVLIPTGKMHDSGYQTMKCILCDYDEIVGAVSGWSDVIHLDGIGGYGLNWESAFVSGSKPISGWKIDCLPKSGCIRLYVNCNKNIKLPNFFGSDLELFVVDKKEGVDHGE